MFQRDLYHQELKLKVILQWILMCFSAGIMNTVAFVGLGTFATHVTGFASLIGVNVANFNILNLLAAVFVPAFFLLGTVISGLCIEARLNHGKKTHYHYVMYLSSALLISATIISLKFPVGLNQSHEHIENNFILLSLICLTSGLINAAFSSSSKATLRITHLTGTVTDIGRGLAEYLTLERNQLEKKKQLIKINLLRALTVLGFISGSIIGAVFFQLIAFKILFLPAIFFSYAGFHASKTP